MKKRPGQRVTGKAGRPAGGALPEPTKKQRKFVEQLAAIGFTQEEISIAMQIGENYLRKAYPAELRRGGLLADAKVLTNLFRMASGKGPEAGRTAIFWAKVRRRWHEVQRVIHGYDPEIVSGFVKQVTALLRRELPKCCPHCKVALDLPEKIAAQLAEISQRMAEKLPPSEIVPMPKPQTAETE